MTKRKMKQTRRPGKKQDKNQQKNTYRRLLKIPLLILAILILLIATAHLLIEGYEREIFAYITGRIEKKTGGRYKIKAGSADLNLLSRSIRIRDLTLTPVPGKTIKRAMHARVQELDIEAVSPWDLVINRTLNARRIRIKQGQLLLTRPNGETIVALPSLEGYLKNARLGKRITVKEISLSIKDPEYHTRDGFYRISADTLKLQTEGFSIFMTGFRLTPRYERYEFSRKKGYACNRLEFKADALTGADLDFIRLFKGRELLLREVTLVRPVLDIFRNRKMRRKPVPRKDRFPRQLLSRIRVPFSLDRLKVENGELDYTELAPGGRLPGSLILKEIDLELDKLTNHPKRIEEGAVLKLSARALLMGAGEFRTRIRVPLDRKDNTFIAIGSLGSMDPKILNKLLTRNLNARIDRGRLDGMTFSMQGNHRKVDGEMKLCYRDLKLTLFKKGGSYKKRWLTSFVANSIIPTHNPKPGRPLRVGRIHYLKEKPVSFFTYLGKALLSGLKSSMRLKRKKR